MNFPRGENVHVLFKLIRSQRRPFAELVEYDETSEVRICKLPTPLSFEGNAAVMSKFVEHFLEF